ncbi:MAG TPA: GNAT family N-acetyltransferase [Ornithinimicrobium sp.]|nr:GNAT family N-acetyltransferase [Ornithinimicrobium sp.]
MHDTQRTDTPSPDVRGGTPPPGAGPTYRWGSLTLDDVEAWSHLVNAVAEVDGTEEFYQPEDLAEELTGHGVDPARDTWAVWAGEEMVAWSAVGCPSTPDHEGHGRAHLEGGVRLEHRGRGLGRALMDAAEPRAAELVAERHPGRPGHLSVGAGLVGSSAQAMLRRRGYADVRWFDMLTRPLAEVPPAPVEPAGVHLVSPGPEHEESTREAHNTAFRDHWGSGPVAPEAWHERWVARSARPALSTLALDEDGRVLSYVLVGEWVDRHAYVNLVGTIPEGRGRGLAAACLARTIRQAADAGGYDVIELDVDSDSPTGATRLYERVGFTRAWQTVAMRRPLAPGGDQ